MSCFQNKWGTVLPHLSSFLFRMERNPSSENRLLSSVSLGSEARTGQLYEYMIHCPSRPILSLRTDEFEVMILSPDPWGFWYILFYNRAMNVQNTASQLLVIVYNCFPSLSPWYLGQRVCAAQESMLVDTVLTVLYHRAHLPRFLAVHWLEWGISQPAWGRGQERTEAWILKVEPSTLGLVLAFTSENSCTP